MQEFKTSPTMGHSCITAVARLCNWCSFSPWRNHVLWVACKNNTAKDVGTCCDPRCVGLSRVASAKNATVD
eukprot:2425880-Lingulodinium_polyedra.AAC.1